MNELTAPRLRELLHYDPRTGIFTRLRSQGCRKSGSVVGSKHFQKDGTPYLGACIDGRHYLLHRLAYLYMKGHWPPRQIDHRNLDKCDNRWDNLRAATHAQNIHNRPASRRSRSGIKGVYRYGKLWIARLSIGGTKTRYVGRFSTAEEAHAAYAAAHRAMFGEFSRAGSAA